MAAVENITQKAEEALQALNIKHEYGYGEAYHFGDARVPQKTSVDIKAKFRIGSYQFEVVGSTLMLEEEKNTEIDNKILDSLLNDVSMMIRIINQKSATTFQETEKVKELRAKFIELTGDLQFYKILPSEFHVSNGRSVKHLGAKE